jgi:hypothetical protein
MFALAPEEDIETIFTRRNYDGSLMITEEVMAWLDYNLACAVIGSLNVVDVVRAAREVYTPSCKCHGTEGAPSLSHARSVLGTRQRGGRT